MIAVAHNRSKHLFCLIILELNYTRVDCENVDLPISLALDVLSMMRVTAQVLNNAMCHVCSRYCAIKWLHCKLYGYSKYRHCLRNHCIPLMGNKVQMTLYGKVFNLLVSRLAKLHYNLFMLYRYHI